MKLSFLVNANSEPAVFEWSEHGYLRVTETLGVHGMPESVGKAVADAYAKAVKEHEAEKQT